MFILAWHEGVKQRILISMRNMVGEEYQELLTHLEPSSPQMPSEVAMNPSYHCPDFHDDSPRWRPLNISHPSTFAEHHDLHDATTPPPHHPTCTAWTDTPLANLWIELQPVVVVLVLIDEAPRSVFADLCIFVYSQAEPLPSNDFSDMTTSIRPWFQRIPPSTIKNPFSDLISHGILFAIAPERRRKGSTLHQL